MIYTELFQHLTALSIRLQYRRAANFKELFTDGWEQKIAYAVGLGDNRAELEAALAELGSTLYATLPNTDGNSADQADNVREIATLIGNLKLTAAACGMFEFERTCEAVHARLSAYLDRLK